VSAWDVRAFIAIQQCRELQQPKRTFKVILVYLIQWKRTVDWSSSTGVPADTLVPDIAVAVETPSALDAEKASARPTHTV
jgi:hypothetical protein